jgi:hypothetical protein
MKRTDMSGLTMSEFEKMVGEIEYSKKVFLGNSGGAPDPDSFRGFGATEQYWNAPTANGWTVAYGDNGAGIVGAVSPDGVKWKHDIRGVGEYVEEGAVVYRGMEVAGHYPAIEGVMRPVK